MKKALGLFVSCTLLSTATINHGFGQNSYSVEYNIPYAEEPHPEQYLDLYWPKKTPSSVIIFVHGGSLQEGGERRNSEAYGYNNVCIPFAENGIGCATVDYRLAPENKWPIMPIDVAAAFKKVHELIKNKNGNRSNVFIFGHSSGCTLTAAVANNPIYLESVGLNQKDIRGAIPMGCILDNRDAALKGLKFTEAMRAGYLRSSEPQTFPMPEDWLDANPSFHVSPNSPPTLVIVAKEERFAPPILEQGSRFVRLLKQEHGVDADILVVPGTHKTSISNIGKNGDPTFNAIINFIKAHQEND